MFWHVRAWGHDPYPPREKPRQVSHVFYISTAHASGLGCLDTPESLENRNQAELAYQGLPCTSTSDVFGLCADQQTIQTGMLKRTSLDAALRAEPGPQIFQDQSIKWRSLANNSVDMASHLEREDYTDMTLP